MEEAKNKENKQPEKTDEKEKEKGKGQQSSGKDKEKKEEQELVMFGVFFSFKPWLTNVTRARGVIFCLSHCRFHNMVAKAELIVTEDA